MSDKPITVLLADDHMVVRTGYRRLLEQSGHIEVVAEAENGEVACRLYQEHTPDVVIMDLSMPGIGGLEASRRILSREPSACILIFSLHDNVLLAERALQAGILGYITKASSPEVLIQAVVTVAQHRKFLGPDIAQSVALRNMDEEDSSLSNLSPREMEIFRLVVEGRSGAEIASTLHLTNKTVSNYLHQIKQKLNVHTSAELVHVAIQNGLIMA
ncbi:MAG: response regulator transcription factor [Gammaproteobacteria bacterium]|nr:response regulator transcription factor [Gammaproteobacteria bacterium]